MRPAPRRALASRLSLIALMLATVGLGACTQRKETTAAGSVEQPFGLAATADSAAPVPSTPAAPMARHLVAAGFAAGNPARSDALAYEHSVAVEVTRELLNQRLEEIQTACRTDAASGCTLLDVSVSSHELVPSGSVRMRLAPAGVDSMIATAAKDGKITSRTTHAEDLAEPVADTERQLALLTTHRERLDELMKNRTLSVDQLITVSRELASVQTQIEQFSTTRANLRRRIDTELLTINLSVPSHEFYAQQSPVMDALRSFGSDAQRAFAGVIRFIAVILPWLIVLVPGTLALRWWWRRTRAR